LLDEECLFPKATDTSFINKLNANHHNKSPNFGKPQFKSKHDFEVAHYAGTVRTQSLNVLVWMTYVCFIVQVGYTVEGWLDKNKDPLNDSVVELLKKSSETFISSIWSDYLGEGMLCECVYIAYLIVSSMQCCV